MFSGVGLMGTVADCKPAIAELARRAGGICFGVSGATPSGPGLYLLSIRKNSSRLKGFAEV